MNILIDNDRHEDAEQYITFLSKVQSIHEAFSNIKEHIDENVSLKIGGIEDLEKADIIFINGTSDRDRTCAHCREIKSRSEVILIVIANKPSDRYILDVIKSGANEVFHSDTSSELISTQTKSLYQIKNRTARKKVVINEYARSIYFDGKTVNLSESEFELFLPFSTNINSIISRKELCLALRNIEYEKSNRSIDMRVSRLRSKLSFLKQAGLEIKTIRNLGYTMVEYR